MKTSVLFGTVLLISSFTTGISAGVTADCAPQDSETVVSYSMLEKLPEFPDGEQAMQDWIERNRKYSDTEAPEIIVLVDFIVRADGSLSDVTVIDRYRSGSPLVKEAARLFRSMPKWEPAISKGKAVSAHCTRTISSWPRDIERNPHVIVPDPYLAWNRKPYEMSTVPKIPEYPGGSKAMYEWVADNIIYPAEAVRAKIEGKVIVRFTISETGSVEDPVIVKGITGSLDNEALRVVGSMPRWEPGYSDGHPVKTSFTMPVTFRLAKER